MIRCVDFNNWSLLMRSDRTNDAPRDVLTSAINIFSQEKRSPLRRIVALLTSTVVMLAQLSVCAHFRSFAAVLYSAEGIDLDLRITVHER